MAQFSSIAKAEAGVKRKPSYFRIILFSALKTATLIHLQLNFSCPPRVFFSPTHLFSHSYQKIGKTRSQGIGSLKQM